MNYLLTFKLGKGTDFMWFYEEEGLKEYIEEMKDVVDFKVIDAIEVVNFRRVDLIMQEAYNE